MAPDANPARRFAEISRSLGDAVEASVPAWIERLVVERVAAWRGEVPPDVLQAAARAGQAARDEVVPQLRALLAADIDDQRANPLALLRGATRHAHAALDELGIPPVERDQFAERSFPDDVHGLVPATWADIDPALHEIGIAWGAAKAFVYTARRRDEDRR